MIVVHVAAVIVSSLLHGENLVGAMFTGFKRRAGAEAPAESARWVVGLLLFAAVGALWASWVPLRQGGAHPATINTDPAVHRGAHD